MDQLKDLEKTVNLLHEEKNNLMDHLRQQENNLHATLREYIKCFEKLLASQESVLRNLKEENEILKSRRN